MYSRPTKKPLAESDKIVADYGDMMLDNYWHAYAEADVKITNEFTEYYVDN